MNNLLHKQIIELFSIENFNIFQDEENYYFFRSLEDIDIECIKNGTITDNNGKIVKLITDREFYGETIYKKTDELSLEQIVEHIKQNYNKHTNCISFSSNTNVILDYGRNIFNDRYIMLKVPKKEFGKNIVNAGCYMFEEINKVIEEYSKTITDDLTKYFFDAIDNAKTQEQLDNIKLMISKDYVDESKNIFINGIEKLISSQNYGALNSKQNLLKDKIILKMDLMKKQILDKIGNKFLINVIGSAFSSLEVIHYNEVLGNITEISSELIDIFSLIQQVDETNEINNLKRILLDKINNGEIQTISFELEKYDVEKFKENLTLANIYNLTKGNIEYGKAKNIYTKAYILAKSRLRKEKSLELLKKILNDNQYDNIIEYLKNNTYGVESEITNRMSNRNSINLSESVNLLISSNEQNILDYINSLNLNEIVNILNNPFVELQKFIEDNYTNQYITENWLANSIIDLIDWSYYGIVEDLSQGQRELLIENLKKNNFMEIYQDLKNRNLKDAEIANTIILQIIRNSTEVDINDRFTLSELEEFLGCNKIIDTRIELKTYQKEAFRAINKTFFEKDYTSVILPTGTGKSYVALAEMHHFETKLSRLQENRHAKILYLAPNNYILSQLERIISTNYRNNFLDNDKNIIKKVFPNLTLSTYSYLASGKDAKDIINDEYDLIIFDELHRTGASEWGKQINELLENQTAKILGITATPERDVDRKDMSEEFAKKYGYTDDEIIGEEHLSYNMDLLEAIKKGIIHNPNVINCEYSLIKDGSLDDLELSIEDITDEKLRIEKRKEYEMLRKEVASADGIEKILKDNLKSDGKYIVFIPITKNEEGKYISTESNQEITESQAQRMIKSYQDLMNQFLFSGEYLENHKEKLSNIYKKINDNEKLSNDDIEYLNNEKSDILLLTKLHINNFPNALQTLSNDMAIKFIEYMNWEILEDSKITSILNMKMKHEVESYNMISDNSKKQNDTALANFNSSQSPKKKFMFVMDMLNEGVHVDKIDGIIWFRALNENSKILFLQQLGRCISAIGENNKNNIPTVIDLVNNTLKVDIKKGVEKEKSDLAKLKTIAKWIENNGFPNSNSSDKETLQNLKTLKRIQNEYQIYLDAEKLEHQNTKRKKIIEKIIKIGSEFDLWNYEFVKTTSINKKNETEEKEDLMAIFGIKGILREFSDLYNDVIENSILTIEKTLKEISEYLKKQEEKITNYYKIEEKLSNGTKIRNWLKYNKQDIIEISKKDSNALYICNYFNWLEEKIVLTQNEIIKEISEYLKKQEEKIVNYAKIEEKLSNGTKIGGWLAYKKLEVIKQSKGNEDALYICNYFNWLEEKIVLTQNEIIKEISEYLKKQEEKIVNYAKIEEKLSNGTKIGRWLSNNKQDIIEISKKDSNALYICNYFNWTKYEQSKKEFAELSKFEEQQKKAKTKENINGRKIS